MVSGQKTDLISIYIDGREAQVPAGINLIEAAAIAGKEIPHYCYHPKLSVVGNCRMCLVEMGMPMKDRQTGQPILDENGQNKIQWIPKPVIGCGSNVVPGVHIKTHSPLIEDCRNGVMEFLLINHPLDCPICDQAGECHLQEFATEYGRGYSRFVEQKVVKPKRTRLGKRVMLDDERCILCSRCIRFCQEVVKDDVLGFVDRGSYSTLTCFPGKQLENNYSLNTVDICPVGALTNIDFRFKMRVWFLKESKSICTESSVGTNTLVASREGKVYRITPRRNDQVNDTWMSDSGRELYKQIESPNRLKDFRINGDKVPVQSALETASQLLREAGSVAYVGNGHCSVEEQFLLKEITDFQPGFVHWVAHTAEGDGLLISTDRTPNVRGALAVGLIHTLPTKDCSALAAKIDTGDIQTLLVYNEDLIQAGLTKEQLSKVHIIYLGTHDNETVQQAKVVLPGLTVFEKSGTFINQQFLVQKFQQAVPGPAGLVPDINILSYLLAQVKHDSFAPPSVETIWEHLSSELTYFKGMHFGSIPETGQFIEGKAFAHLPFCEGKTLHYNPGKTSN